MLEALVPEGWLGISPALGRCEQTQDPAADGPAITFTDCDLAGFGPGLAAFESVRDAWPVDAEVVDRPEPRTPSEAMAAGICPSCMGHGMVTSLVVPGYEGSDTPTLCGTCAGCGIWPPPGAEEPAPA